MSPGWHAQASLRFLGGARSAAAPTLLPMLTSLRRRLAVAPAGPATASVPTSAPRALTRFSPRVRPELAGLLVLAAVLNLWALSRNGWANEYYSAAVRSMTTSWHNFLYGAFDPAGVMTVDKPPLALWVQAASAKVFGFSLAEHARAAGADGRRDGRARLRPHAPLWGRPAGFVAGPRARPDADRGRDLAPQQPGHAADPPAASRRCGRRCAGCRTAARAGSCSRA